MVIQLKRFNNSGHALFRNNIVIDFPIDNLNMRDYMNSYIASDTIYKLYAVICQEGELRGGHYYMYAKDKINNSWYKFDDEHVLFIGSNIELHNATPYLLFYEKC